MDDQDVLPTDVRSDWRFANADAELEEPSDKSRPHDAWRKPPKGHVRALEPLRFRMSGPTAYRSRIAPAYRSMNVGVGGRNGR